jgi:hypothetical protein
MLICVSGAAGVVAFWPKALEGVNEREAKKNTVIAMPAIADPIIGRTGRPKKHPTFFIQSLTWTELSAAIEKPQTRAKWIPELLTLSIG